MKRMIASICVAGSLLIAPIQSFAEVKTGGNQQIVVKDGWVFEQNNWYYYVNNVPASGWKKIQGTWYYFESNGVMKTGWYFDGTNWFYMNSNGGMETGWK
ncbi:cell wall-binding protein, partial [Bacillus pseudomycoides]|nr:cell wall-binding protein [Bacillus pseudomycoides]